jgi:hypothetical protein
MTENLVTPEEAAKHANRFLGMTPEGEKLILEFLSAASAGDIRKFIHCLDTTSGMPRCYDRARTALDFRLSKDADLIAEKLSNQTDRLINYTIGLWAFTLVLVVIAILQVVIMVMDYRSKNHEYADKSTKGQQQTNANPAQSITLTAPDGSHFTWSDQQLNEQNGGIFFVKNDPFQVQLHGSAFVFGKSNYVVTCYHVWQEVKTNALLPNLRFVSKSGSAYALNLKCVFPSNDIALFTTQPPMTIATNFAMGNFNGFKSNHFLAYCGENYADNTDRIAYGKVIEYGTDTVNNDTVNRILVPSIDFTRGDAWLGYSGGGVYNMEGEIVGLFCEIDTNAPGCNSAQSIEVLRPFFTN